ncbi:MAG: ribosome silencing factor [Candidatus Marinimicrobia bacterium]|jgi:ribosome-associated protein|nr:ribosome silencing factor [Candidatus Neomarinimicrobiota bacterium]MBT3937961.1 ribosome silencing factor [Candidatus Neomarinimicrobiota bacterium]MBT3962219.1 ribosome silencing factor [Candidatus Neomarinimicrobiota bacterium]MBT4383792.1 ribosome silencing factor [Candidatus Neomarinimicrobiota bacterium]MBT4636916.1 ribosome silencing factor [Candidatus Neomarinimicrobiota bacterium]
MPHTIESPGIYPESLGQIAELALAKKAETVVGIDVRGLTSIADYFLICSADTEPQIKAIVDSIRRGTPHKPWHLEGYENSAWVLLDYIDVVVHVFKTEEREYYGLEKLWADAPLIPFEDEAPETTPE